jgi:hypothetical protein
MPATAELYAGAGASVAADGGLAWNLDGHSESNISATSEGASTATYAKSFISEATWPWTQILQGSSFGAAVPTATIDGITVKIRGKSDDNGRGGIKRVWLANNGTQLGSIDTTLGSLTTSDQVFTYGGASSLWGATLTDTIVNSANFQVRMQVQYLLTDGGQTGVFIDHITLTINYTEGGGGGSGSVTLVGRAGRLIHGRLVR